MHMRGIDLTDDWKAALARKGSAVNPAQRQSALTVSCRRSRWLAVPNVPDQFGSDDAERRGWGCEKEETVCRNGQQFEVS